MCDIICGTSFSMVTGACEGGLGSLTCEQSPGLSKTRMMAQCGATAVCSSSSYIGKGCDLCEYEPTVKAKFKLKQLEKSYRRQKS